MGSGPVPLVSACTAVAGRLAPKAEFGYFLSEDGPVLVTAGGVGVGRGVAAAGLAEEAAVAVGVRVTTPQAEGVFFPSEMTARRREAIAVEVRGGPAAFDNIGSGRRVSRRLVSSTLKTNNYIERIIT